MNDKVANLRNAARVELDELDALVGATIEKLVARIEKLEALAERAKRAKKAHSGALRAITENFLVDANEIWEAMAEFAYQIGETRKTVKATTEIEDDDA